MQVDPALIDLAEFRSAVDAELDAPPRLLPPSLIHPALETKRDEVAEWAAKRVAGRFLPTAQETVLASKANHGVRPVVVWDLPSRLLYQVLTGKLGRHLPALTRDRAAWKMFLRKPLEAPGAYVVTSDIAACYEHIDHGLLADELLIQTGEHLAVSTISELLRSAAGKTYSLPQQSSASDVLAEAFLDMLERALVRRGLVVARYNDDFRFTCRTWSDVVRSLEVLSDEARRIGLTVNDVKTVTWGRKKYEDHLDEADRMREEIAREASLDLTDYDVHPYTNAVVAIEPSQASVNHLAAVRIVERWEGVAGRGRVAERRRPEHRAVLELLPFALATLTASRETDPKTLRRCMKMLRFERTMTPAVGTYLVNLDSEAEILEAFTKLLRGRGYLNAWQAWWMQQPLARCATFASAAGGTSRTRWVKNVFTSTENPTAIRVPAAFTLARHGHIALDDVLALYDRSSEAVRPSACAVVAIMKPAKDVARAVKADSPLNEWVYEWAERFA